MARAPAPGPAARRPPPAASQRRRPHPRLPAAAARRPPPPGGSRRTHGAGRRRGCAGPPPPACAPGRGGTSGPLLPHERDPRPNRRALPLSHLDLLQPPFLGRFELHVRLVRLYLGQHLAARDLLT